MKKPHKHAEVIKAWADGAEIEYLETMTSKEPYWANAPMPKWSEETMYRVKPEPKPDVVYYGAFDLIGSTTIDSCFTKMNDEGDQIKLTFDGETRKLIKAEVL
jgi:hypothetical protein